MKNLGVKTDKRAGKTFFLKSPRQKKSKKYHAGGSEGIGKRTKGRIIRKGDLVEHDKVPWRNNKRSGNRKEPQREWLMKY